MVLIKIIINDAVHAKNNSFKKMGAFFMHKILNLFKKYKPNPFSNTVDLFILARYRDRPVTVP